MNRFTHHVPAIMTFYVLKRIGYGADANLQWVGRVEAATPREALDQGLSLDGIEPGTRIELAGYPEMVACKRAPSAVRQAA